MSQSSRKALLEDDSEEMTKAMDRLCLALALLTNLLQELDTLAYSMEDISEYRKLHPLCQAKSLRVRLIVFSVSCPRKAACLHSCQCENAITSVAALVNMYIALLKLDGDESVCHLEKFGVNIELIYCLFVVDS